MPKRAKTKAAASAAATKARSPSRLRQAGFSQELLETYYVADLRKLKRVIGGNPEEDSFEFVPRGSL
jgi:hypothetical protein